MGRGLLVSSGDEQDGDSIEQIFNSLLCKRAARFEAFTAHL